jgi:hypothetical protein
VEMQRCLGAARNKRRGWVLAIKDLAMAACYWFLLPEREKLERGGKLLLFARHKCKLAIASCFCTKLIAVIVNFERYMVL